ncbi:MULTISPECIES: ArnT family glycosyltransferase [Candidatus Kuenenia]|uniref:ArnT family glycosyltransferase n=1 Tax=Candidatus Kuenenia TaxID=380738 RepID=UPI0012FF522F|nr:glycosyltransferase family 39 protein [Candidatus Kuenenia stuttgartiensis]
MLKTPEENNPLNPHLLRGTNLTYGFFGKRGFQMINIFRRQRTPFFDLFVLAILSAVVLFLALGQNRHWSSREIRHAEIIREMAESGDYLVPRLLGKVYYDKPPVMHAPAALLTRLMGGPSMTIARLPSAVAGMIGILATYGIGLLFFDRRTALIGAIALLGTIGYSKMAREARPDMILCASILLSCLCLGLGMKKQIGFPRVLWLVSAGLFAGLGAITKGPYGVLVPVLFAVFAPIRRQDFKRPRSDWFWFAFALVAVLAIWAIPAYLRDNGEYLRNVLSQPDLNVTKKDSGNPFYYLSHGFLYSLPPLLFLPCAIADLRRRGYSAPLAIAGALFVIISCIPKKRPHYFLPLEPFIALGIANALVHYCKSSQLVRRAAWLIIPLPIIAIPLYFTTIQPLIQPYKNSEMYLAQEVYKVTGLNAQIYCSSGDAEVLAWVGQQYKRIHRLNTKDPHLSIRDLCNAEANSYLVISEDDLKSIYKDAEPFLKKLILQRKAHNKKKMLFLIGVKDT